MSIVQKAWAGRLWRGFCRFYVASCKALRKDRLTISAWAWKHFQETGNSWARNRIDGAALLIAGQRDHCQQQFQRESRSTPDA